MTEPGYSGMLLDRSSSMSQKLGECVTSDLNVIQMKMTESKVGPRRNLEEMIEEPDLADNLFIAGEGNLIQWSVSKNKVVKDYGSIMAAWIWSLVKTSDKKYLFVGAYDGC